MSQHTLLCGLALFTTTALATFFGVSHPSYVGYFMGTTANQLAKIKMGCYTSSLAVVQARMACNRRCNHQKDCKSNFVYRSNVNVYCILVSVNTCDTPQTSVKPYVTATNYDKIQDTDIPKSCRHSCLEANNGSCDACHRPSCRTSDCTVCDHTCQDCNANLYFNLSSSEELKCQLWGGVQNLVPFNITCYREKFLLFRRTSLPNASSTSLDQKFLFELPGAFETHVSKTMFVELQVLDTPLQSNSTTTIFTATYAELTIKSNRNLSLGDLINGTAGNGMYSPLSNVSFVSNSSLYSSSCGQFWNISGAFRTTEPTPYGTGPCPGLGTAFWGEAYLPVNASETDVFRSGIAWSTLPGYTIVQVSIWMF